MFETANWFLQEQINVVILRWIVTHLQAPMLVSKHTPLLTASGNNSSIHSETVPHPS